MEGEGREKPEHLLPAPTSFVLWAPCCGHDCPSDSTVPWLQVSPSSPFVPLALSHGWRGSGFSLLIISGFSFFLAGSFNFVHACIDYPFIHLCVAFCGSSIFNSLSHSIHQEVQSVLL